MRRTIRSDLASRARNVTSSDLASRAATRRAHSSAHRWAVNEATRAVNARRAAGHAVQREGREAAGVAVALTVGVAVALTVGVAVALTGRRATARSTTAVAAAVAKVAGVGGAAAVERGLSRWHAPRHVSVGQVASVGQGGLGAAMYEGRDGGEGREGMLTATKPSRCRCSRRARRQGLPPRCSPPGLLARGRHCCECERPPGLLAHGAGAGSYIGNWTTELRRSQHPHPRGQWQARRRRGQQ